MKRRAYLVAGSLVVGAGLASLAACGSPATVKAAGHPTTTGAGVTTTNGAGAGSGHSGAGGKGSSGGTSSGSGGSGSGSGAASTAPAIVSATATCEVTSYEDLPGLSHQPLYSPVLNWTVKNATGMALSVDNPGLVGSYGTYGSTGSLTLGGGCYDNDQTTITFYTDGGTGPRASKTIVLTGTHTMPVAPPIPTTTTTVASTTTTHP